MSCKLCGKGKQSAEGVSTCSDIDVCGDQKGLLPKQLHKCWNSKCKPSGTTYTCGKCTDKTTWTAYERHAIDNSIIEVEDYNVTCDFIYYIGERASDEDCREACWDSVC